MWQYSLISNSAYTAQLSQCTTESTTKIWCSQSILKRFLWNSHQLYLLSSYERASVENKKKKYVRKKIPQNIRTSTYYRSWVRRQVLSVLRNYLRVCVSVC